MITIYFVVYNEEVRLQFMIDHYRSRFCNCNFVMYNNGSTDNSVDIAKKNNCEIIPYDTNGKHNDELLTKLKNNCWKSSKTDWVLICDPDELLDINEQQLNEEDISGTTIIKASGWNMINMNDEINYDLASIKYGVRSTPHDKLFLFNKKYITEINYNHGSHVANPIGKIKYNDNTYNMYHYHFINRDFVYNRYQMTAKRFAEINIKNGWGKHCLLSIDELNIKINNLRKNAIKVI